LSGRFAWVSAEIEGSLKPVSQFVEVIGRFALGLSGVVRIAAAESFGGFDGVFRGRRGRLCGNRGAAEVAGKTFDVIGEFGLASGGIGQFGGILLSLGVADGVVEIAFGFGERFGLIG
jgi:hypothetical protein